MHSCYVLPGSCRLLALLAAGPVSWGATPGSADNDVVLPEAGRHPFIYKVLEHGINFFDMVDVYNAGNAERVVGKALRDSAERDAYVLATKVFNPVTPMRAPNEKGLFRKQIISATGATGASLQRLGTDYIDLYQMHRWDPNTPIE